MNVLINNPPPWQVEQWLNTNKPISLESLKGRVIALHTFQMLCPGCVAHGLPQANMVQKTFNRDDVAVIGLHTVFEHHSVMTARALEVFVHEYGWSFPIGIDKPAKASGTPLTMAAYDMRGTPSLLLFDHLGRLRYHGFGRPDDMLVGAKVMALVAERDRAETRSTIDSTENQEPESECTKGVCSR